MTQFIRVRSKGGPDAEYDVGLEEATANPDLYDVVDKEPVDTPRPTTYGTKPKAAAKSSGKAPAEAKAAAPNTSVGDPNQKETSQ